MLIETDKTLKKAKVIKHTSVFLKMDNNHRVHTGNEHVKFVCLKAVGKDLRDLILSLEVFG